MKSTAVADNAMPFQLASTERSGAVGEYRMPAKVLHWLTAALVFFLVASGVVATQLGEGWGSDLLFGLHKLTGAVTLAVVLVRLGYRLLRSMPRPQKQPRSRLFLQWTLYGIVILVPLLGWAGASDFNSRDMLFGYSLPAIFPESTGYGDLLLHLHAYLAFGLLVIVALHIGAAMHDYMIGDQPSEPEK